MGILPLKKRVNRDKCSFATKQRMFGVFAIEKILRYRGTRFPGSRTLCHPAPNQVTEGAPTFATDSKFGDLLVVVVPRQGPRIVGARER